MAKNVEINSHGEIFKLYRYRWYMLAVVALLNFSCGVIWITFSNIADISSTYFEASTFQIDLLSIVFMVATLIFGIPALWLLERGGMKPYLYVAAICNFLGAGIRYLSIMPYFQNYKYIILLTGQTIAGCAQPFMMFAPTKLVSQWFGADERTIANTIGSLSNPIGFSLGGLIPALLVSGVNGDDTNGADIHLQMRYMMGATAIPAFLALVMTFGVFNSEPPTPPSSSADHEIQPFHCGLKMLLRMKQYLLLAFCFGSGIGIIGSAITVMSQLLIPHGYSNAFCASGISFLVLSGFVGATIASIIADKYKNHELVAKVAFCLGIVFILAFIVVSHFPNMDIPLIVILAIAGFFSMAVSPICLELSVESTYPVAVGTSSGMMLIFSQLMSTLLTFLVSIGSQPITKDQGGEIINQYSLMAYMAVITPIPILFLLFFSSPNLRINFEWMTSEGLQLLPEDERESMVEKLMEPHARCICNRRENDAESPLVVNAVGDDNDAYYNGGDDDDAYYNGGDDDVDDVNASLLP